VTTGRCYSASNDNQGALEARKRLCHLYDDGDDLLMRSDTAEDSLLDSEVSQLLQGTSSPPALDHFPLKRVRQQDTSQSHGHARSVHPAAGAVSHLPRPSLDLYKMQVQTTSHFLLSL